MSITKNNTQINGYLLYPPQPTKHLYFLYVILTNYTKHIRLNTHVVCLHDSQTLSICLFYTNKLQTLLELFTICLLFLASQGTHLASGALISATPSFFNGVILLEVQSSLVNLHFDSLSLQSFFWRCMDFNTFLYFHYIFLWL